MKVPNKKAWRDLSQKMSLDAEDAELRVEAAYLQVQDIGVAAKELFDLYPGTRQFEVRVTDDGVVVVSPPHE